jgi:hypothetical protein
MLIQGCVIEPPRYLQCDGCVRAVEDINRSQGLGNPRQLEELDTSYRLHDDGSTAPDTVAVVVPHAGDIHKGHIGLNEAHKSLCVRGRSKVLIAETGEGVSGDVAGGEVGVGQRPYQLVGFGFGEFGWLGVGPQKNQPDSILATKPTHSRIRAQAILDSGTTHGEHNPDTE